MLHIKEAAVIPGGQISFAHSLSEDERPVETRNVPTFYAICSLALNAAHLSLGNSVGTRAAYRVKADSETPLFNSVRLFGPAFVLFEFDLDWGIACSANLHGKLLGIWG